MMINSLQMREVPNGCIIIDAQPCRKKLCGSTYLRVAAIRHYSGLKVLNHTTTHYKNEVIT